MAPKAAPEPAPEVEEGEGDEPQGPSLFGMQMTEKKIKAIGGLDMDSQDNVIRRRNAQLEEDRKLLSLQAASKSIERGRGAATRAQNDGSRWPGRSEGTEVQEKFIRALSPTREEVLNSTGTLGMGATGGSSQHRAISPAATRRPVSGGGGAAELASLTATGGFGARAGATVSSSRSLQHAGARSMDPLLTMHRSMTRMFQDLEMANEAGSKAAPRLRCGQVDKMHQWFETHRPKEKKPKADAAPSFLTFSKEDRVMTGSMRCEPDERRYAPLPWATVKQTPGWLSRSSSSPSIVHSDPSPAPASPDGASAMPSPSGS